MQDKQDWDVTSQYYNLLLLLYLLDYISNYMHMLELLS